MYNVEGGHRAVMYDKIRGVLPQSVGEGTGFKIPMVQEPIIMDVRSRPKEIRSITGTKDLQMVNIYLRVLSRPRVDKLPVIFQKYNTNWEDRVIPVDRQRGAEVSGRAVQRRAAPVHARADLVSFSVLSSTQRPR